MPAQGPAAQPRTELDARYSSANNPRPGAAEATATEWAEAQRGLETAEIFWASTVRPDGRLHVTPVIAAWHDGVLYFSTGPGEQKAKNLAHDAHCALTTGSNSLTEGLDLVVEGKAEPVTDPALLEQVITAYEAKYGPHITSPRGHLPRHRRRVPHGRRRGIRGGTDHGLRLRPGRRGVHPYAVDVLTGTHPRAVSGIVEGGGSATEPYGEAMGWKTEEFGASHEGWVGAVLEDGTEPKKVYLDPGSGPDFHETREWWAYTGRLNRPLAARVRGACSCGWRGEREYAIDWDQVPRFSAEFPSPEPQDDWWQHISDVEARTIPLPQELEELLDRVEVQLSGLVEDAPLAALKAIRALECTTKRIGRIAADYVNDDELSEESAGRALGLLPNEVRSRLLHYSLRH